MLVLGIESSCDETGVALVEAAATGVPALLTHALHSQIDMHQAYGGVVPELASRDHIRRVLPLATQVMNEAGRTLAQVDVVAYTRGPGLAGRGGPGCAQLAGGTGGAEDDRPALSRPRPPRMACSRCGATTRCPPTRPHRWSRPRRPTVATRSSSRCSPT